MAKWMLVAAGLTLIGCAKGPQLEPAPEARPVTGGAEDYEQGVTMTVRPDQWKGLPIVGDVVEPIELVIDNDSSRALRVRYDQFALVEPGGRRFRPAPPSEVEVGDLTLVSQLYDYGLTEGRVEPGSTFQGFLYFEELPEEVRRVTFEADLVDDYTGEQFGRVTIPFLVAHDDDDLIGTR